jgi:Ca2+/H+ antiporter, TMEM165/GDT1 family
MGTFWSAMALITIAEMGDKTQLVSLAFATRFRPHIVLLGVFIATLAVHLFSVAIGQVLGVALPTFWIAIAAGLAFVGFGLWTLRGDKLDDGEHGSRFAKFGPLLMVAATFFLAELGDKTMLATVTIASQEMNFIPVWLGSMMGMVIADGFAIIIGVAFGRRLPERAIKMGSAAVFIFFGLWGLFQTLMPVVSTQAAIW